MNKPYVLDIKGNSLDDGPGIRTTIFFKGCPLSCIWCHNPESKRVVQELSWDKETCIGDLGCLNICKSGALSLENTGFVDRNKCQLCFKCADFCPAKALTKVGEDKEIEELVSKAASDIPFYKVSGGGVTLSGGEATMFPEWVGDLCKALYEKGIDILLETCGYFDYEKVKKYMLPYIKDIYCDLKIFDREEHKKYCGVYNDLILENIRKMKEDEKNFGYKLLTRTPLIPDITDTEQNLSSIADFLKEIGMEKTVILPYNPTWYAKTEKIGVELDPKLKGLNSFQDKEHVENARNIFRNKGVSC